MKLTLISSDFGLRRVRWPHPRAVQDRPRDLEYRGLDALPNHRVEEPLASPTHPYLPLFEDTLRLIRPRPCVYTLTPHTPLRPDVTAAPVWMGRDLPPFLASFIVQYS